MAIMRKEFNLKDPQDSLEINRLVDRAVAQNKSKYPAMTRDHIEAGSDESLWYAQTDGKLFRRENSTWKQDPIGNLDIVTVYNKNQVSGINSKGEIWRLYNGKWQQFLEISPDGQTWQYAVTANDSIGLGKIVMDRYHVQDSATINRIIDKIAELSHLPNRDRIDVGQTLTMPPLSYRG